MLCQISQEILKASKNYQSSWKALRLTCTQLARICFGRSKSCFLYSFVLQVTSEKTLCSKQRFHNEFERDFYMKILVTIIPTNVVTNSLLSHVCPFVEIKNKMQVGDLVMRNISAFCLQRVALYFKGMPNSIGLYKEFSHMLFLLVLQFHVNTEIQGVNLRTQGKYGKIWTKKNSIFGHFSRRGSYEKKNC